jgi:hypothetical protein
VDENLCTSPGCYREKCAADWNARKSAKLAEIRAGVEKGGNGEGEASKRVGALAARLIVEGERASRVFGGPGGSVAYDSALRKAGDRPGVDLAVNVSPGEEPLTWRELASNAGLPLVLALNPHSGRGEEMVEWAAVVEKTRGNARAGGFKSVFCRVGVAAEREEPKEQEQEREQEQEQESGAESRANAAVGRAIARESRGSFSVLRRSFDFMQNVRRCGCWSMKMDHKRQFGFELWRMLELEVRFLQDLIRKIVEGRFLSKYTEVWVCRMRIE